MNHDIILKKINKYSTKLNLTNLDKYNDKLRYYNHLLNQVSDSIIGGAVLPGFYITLAGKWDPSYIYDELNGSGASVMTLITPQVYSNLKEYTTTLGKDLDIVEINMLDYVKCKSTLESKISSLNQDIIKVNTLPTDGIIKLEYKSELSQSDKDYLEIRVTKMNNIVTQLQSLTDTTSIYSKNLNIIFSSKMAKHICNLIIRNEYIKKDRNHIRIGIFSAGQAEADIVTLGYIYLSIIGYNVHPRIDLGVDNIKKTKSILEFVNKIDIIVTTAGMEAILPTVINNITHKPVIAVPSNVSYGFGQDGIVSLQSILYSDSPGLAVFNIGNIYGAANFANVIGEYLVEREKRLPPIRPVSVDDAELRKCFTPLLTNSFELNGTRYDINYHLSDLTHAIKRNVNLINAFDKSNTGISDFVKTKSNIVIRNNTGKYLQFDFTDFRTENNLYIKNDINTETRQNFYDTSKKVLIIYGGMSDINYVNEFTSYMNINGISTDSILLDINHILLHSETINKITDNYNICVVIAGLNGTLSNVVGGIFNTKPVPVIGVPITSSVNENIGEYTTMSMLNNCVGGIAVVSVNNIYSAACLTLAILSLITFTPTS